VVEDVEKIRSRLKSKPLPESELPPQRQIDLRRAESAQGVSSQISLPPALRIDPARIRRNPLAPPVAIRSMVADGKPYPVSQDAALPPLTRNLRIGYAALSLSIPERVRARYKLEGSDKDWQDAGNRRDAFYTNLGPRKYTFRVIACNNDGIWNETGASWSFEIEPAFYQTAWFHVLYVLAGATMIWLVYRFRLRQMTARVNLCYTERLAERTRIARELHDTLLQSFQGVMFRFQAVRNMLPRRPEEAMQALDGVLERTDQAIAEGRDAIQGLRSSTMVTNELAQAVTALGNEMSREMASQDSAHDSARFHVMVEGRHAICIRSCGTTSTRLPARRSEMLSATHRGAISKRTSRITEVRSSCASGMMERASIRES
jgi:hypothetical protein